MIGLIDADLLARKTSHFPNLALMKISGWHKNKGDDTTLILSHCDIWKCKRFYCSKVFSSTPDQDWFRALKNVSYGGTGYNLQNAAPLKNEIEHTKPDYTLYKPFIDTYSRARSEIRAFIEDAIGFTTRGCFRRCPFCVNKNKTSVEKWSPVQEFDAPDRKRIVLLDDNILGFAGWRGVFDELKEANKPFQFKQGVDMRLMTTEKARAFQDAKYAGDITFALDQLGECDLFAAKARIFREHCNKNARAYVLTGYYEKGEFIVLSVIKRIWTLIKFNILPYIMRYETCYTSEWASLINSLAAWCNQPQFFKTLTFKEFMARRPCVATSEQFKRISNTSVKAFLSDWHYTKAI